MLNWARLLSAVVTVTLLPVAAIAQEGAAEPAGSQEATPEGDTKALEEEIEALKKKVEKLGSADVSALEEEIARLREQLEVVSGSAADNLERVQELESALASEGEGGAGLFDIGLEGYLRTEFVAIGDDEKTDFIGLNDGFVLGNARLGVVGTVDDFSFRLQFDGAVDRRDARNTSTGEVKTELKDAWMAWSQGPWLNLQLGQFKPPYDAEEQRATTSMLFVSRALESRGVKGVEGVDVEGLSVDRQVGLLLRSDPIAFGGSGLGGSYALAMTNGTSANEPLNDNDALAFYGRLEFHYKDLVVLGAGAFLNDRTTGELADLIDERRVGVAADISVTVAGVVLQGQFMQTTSSFPDLTVQKSEVAQGFHLEVGYEFLSLGLVPAYRFAFLDPTSSFEVVDENLAAILDRDELTHHTFGLTWNLPESPVRLQANYTLTLEDPARVFNNDRLELLGQLVF
jgi:hypothetical protein